MVGVLGLEPRSLAAQDFESSVFTNFTILPHRRCLRRLVLYHWHSPKGNAVNWANRLMSGCKYGHHDANRGDGAMDEHTSPLADGLTGSAQADRVLAFVTSTKITDIPEEVCSHARYLLLDLLGVAAVGSGTPTARIISGFAVANMSAGTAAPSAPILFDGRCVSPAGAALAGGMMIDSIDAHDGHKLVKGHVGCSLLPAVLAALAATGRQADEEELLAALIIGYEIGVRCGMALHSTVSDYHTSGAWMAVAVAAVTGRIYGLPQDQIWHAMGIAEYHGPRSQMMRVIDHASMLKDGSGWGAMAGVSAADLARAGFTGAPAVTISDEGLGAIWSDLGTRWRTTEQYIKLWPVCRWAQPAMQAVFDISDQTPVHPDEIERIEIDTFHESLRLASPHPRSGDEAQYSICWPVAAAVFAVHEGRRFGAWDVSEAALARSDIHGLSARISVQEDQAFNAVFPAKRQSRVTITLTSGEVLQAAALDTKGDPETPASYEEMIEKFQIFMAETPHRDSAFDLQAACLSAAQNPPQKPIIADIIYSMS